MRRAVRGTKSHKHIMNPIIATTLYCYQSPYDKPMEERENSQGLQSPDALPGRDDAGQKWQERRAGLAEAGYPPDGTCEQPVRKNARGVVHDDGVDGSKENTD